MRSPRHVGQIVDPLVREDGVDEPEMNLDSALAVEGDGAGELRVPHRVSGGEVAGESPADPADEVPAAARAEGSSGGSHPVRDRLLARAAEAVRSRPEQDSSAFDRASRDDQLGARGEELERVAARHAPPSSPGLARKNRDLPPNLIALFGAVFGLAFFGALFAILIHVDPRDGSPIVGATVQPVPAAIAPSPSATVSAPPPSPTVPKPNRNKIPGPWRISDSTDGALKKVEGTIGHDPFLKAIEDAGIPHAQTFRILAVMKGLRDLDHCAKNDHFAALVDRGAARVTAFEYIVSKEEVYQARQGQDGFLKAAKLDLAVERTRIQGAIVFDRPTFVDSIEAAGFEPALVSVLDDALAGHDSVADFRKGDRLRVVAQEVTVLGDFERYAGVEALEYVPANGDAKPVRIYYFHGSKSHGYYDAESRAVHEGGWHKPIKGAPITSPFNPHRMHPILHKIMPHEGTDFGAAMGTPVGAAGPGVVEFIGNGGPTGNLVRIQHTGGIETGYAHLSRFEPGLKVGDRVVALQIIGYVGSTGRSTGPHLHFSVKKDGVFVNSDILKLDSLRVLPLEERPEFAEARQKLDVLLDAIPLPKPFAGAALAASPPSAAEPPADDIGAGDPNVAESPPSASAGSPPATQPASVAPPAPATSSDHKGPSIYMSDQDLLQNQTATDNGEVAE